ncbi:hypothetical protein N0V83_009991 [Neocucurbitaria cava]|uniref:Uncharacterized protein n=1 Tax=Neocucurbitaria cava TaxID=798079 RepID=A0A9W9CHJ9_9PLEO|nr:hypothetical protein N0V83_009991 [Neocucurbitaria cava]
MVTVLQTDAGGCNVVVDARFEVDEGTSLVEEPISDDVEVTGISGVEEVDELASGVDVALTADDEASDEIVVIAIEVDGARLEDDEDSLKVDERSSVDVDDAMLDDEEIDPLMKEDSDDETETDVLTEDDCCVVELSRLSVDVNDVMLADDETGSLEDEDDGKELDRTSLDIEDTKELVLDGVVLDSNNVLEVVDEDTVDEKGEAVLNEDEGVPGKAVFVLKEDEVASEDEVVLKDDE